MADRIVALLDLDYFYAQVEELDDPSLKGKAVVVGMYSGRTAESGAVATCNYLARGLGIKSAMPLIVAKRLAEKAGVDTVFIKSRMERYREISQRVVALVKTVSPMVQTVGLDEAYFDLGEESGGDWKKAEAIAKKLKSSILSELHLACSIGIGPNKLVAKIACDAGKPNGLAVVRETDAESFLSPLPVKKLLGVGPKTEEKLSGRGISVISDLRKVPKTQLQEWFGPAKGELLYNSSRGIDGSELESDRKKKGVSVIKTLKTDARSAQDAVGILREYLAEGGGRGRSLVQRVNDAQWQR
jgi:DNA polymerase IV (DinB-like DNA polymerase)